jgi:hypothetical protein
MSNNKFVKYVYFWIDNEIYLCLPHCYLIILAYQLVIKLWNNKYIDKTIERKYEKSPINDRKSKYE